MVIKTIGDSVANQIIIDPNDESSNLNLASLFVEKRHRSLARCHSIDIGRLIKNNSVYSIQIE